MLQDQFHMYNCKAGLLSEGEKNICLELLQNQNLNPNQKHFLQSLVNDYSESKPVEVGDKDILYKIYWNQNFA